MGTVREGYEDVCDSSVKSSPVKFHSLRMSPTSRMKEQTN